MTDKAQRKRFDRLMRDLIPLFEAYETEGQFLGCILDPPWNVPDKIGEEFVWDGGKFNQHPKIGWR